VTVGLKSATDGVCVPGDADFASDGIFHGVYTADIQHARAGCSLITAPLPTTRAKQQ